MKWLHLNVINFKTAFSQGISMVLLCSVLRKKEALYFKLHLMSYFNDDDITNDLLHEWKQKPLGFYTGKTQFCQFPFFETF